MIKKLLNKVILKLIKDKIYHWKIKSRILEKQILKMDKEKVTDLMVDQYHTSIRNIGILEDLYTALNTRN